MKAGMFVSPNTPDFAALYPGYASLVREYTRESLVCDDS